MKYEGDLLPEKFSIVDLPRGEDHTARSWGSLEGWKWFPVIASKGSKGLSSKTTRSWILPITGISLETDISLEPPDKFSFWLTLISSLWYSATLRWTSDLQNWKLIDGCCFKPLNYWWYFVTQQEKTYTSEILKLFSSNKLFTEIQRQVSSGWVHWILRNVGSLKWYHCNCNKSSFQYLCLLSLETMGVLMNFYNFRGIALFQKVDIGLSLYYTFQILLFQVA